MKNQLYQCERIEERSSRRHDRDESEKCEQKSSRSKSSFSFDNLRKWNRIVDDEQIASFIKINKKNRSSLYAVADVNFNENDNWRKIETFSSRNIKFCRFDIIKLKKNRF